MQSIVYAATEPRSYVVVILPGTTKRTDSCLQPGIQLSEWQVAQQHDGISESSGATPYQTCKGRFMRHPEHLDLEGCAC